MVKSGGLIQFIKFGLVGVSNTLVDWGVFFVITRFILLDKSDEPVAKAIAFLVAVVNSFIWNSIWTFKKEFKSGLGEKNQRVKRGGVIFIRFIGVSLVGWGINVLIFKLTRFNLDQGQLLSLIAASAAATVWNFFANKLWTYKSS